MQKTGSEAEVMQETEIEAEDWEQGQRLGSDAGDWV